MGLCNPSQFLPYKSGENLWNLIKNINMKKLIWNHLKSSVIMTNLNFHRSYTETNASNRYKPLYFYSIYFGWNSIQHIYYKQIMTIVYLFTFCSTNIQIPVYHVIGRQFDAGTTRKNNYLYAKNTKEIINTCLN